MQVCILCNFNLCVEHFALFHRSPTLVEDRETIASLERSRPSRGKMIRIRAGKERVRNMFDVKVLQLMEDSEIWVGTRNMG